MRLAAKVLPRNAIDLTLLFRCIFSQTLPALLLCLSLFFGKLGYSQTDRQVQPVFDHILLFTNNTSLKDSLDKIFTPAEKLTTEHPNQGTVGYYYLFYNTYIELLFLQDSAQAKANAQAFGSAYINRWSTEGAANPIGFGLLLNQWDTSAHHKGFHRYFSADSPEGEYYLMPLSNRDSAQAFLYISPPDRRYEALDSLSDIQMRPAEIQADLRDYLSHKSEVKRLSQIHYSYPENETPSATSLLQQVEFIQSKKTKDRSLKLVFDEGNDQKLEFPLNDKTTLILQF